jgi:DNA-binding CsgD family transcriptional regulator
MMLAQAKRRAVQFNRDFDLTLEDVKDLVVYTCPVLGVELRWRYGHGQSRDNSPSLDRIDNTRGYVKGNVAIISAKANTLKSNLTKEEAKAVASYVANPEKHLRRPRQGPSKPARKQAKITSEMEEQIWVLHLDGVPYREIAKTLGVSKSSVGYVVNRLRFS